MTSSTPRQPVNNARLNQYGPTCQIEEIVTGLARLFAVDAASKPVGERVDRYERGMCRFCFEKVNPDTGKISCSDCA